MGEGGGELDGGGSRICQAGVMKGKGRVVAGGWAKSRNSDELYTVALCTASAKVAGPTACACLIPFMQRPNSRSESVWLCSWSGEVAAAATCMHIPPAHRKWPP